MKAFFSLLTGIPLFVWTALAGFGGGAYAAHVYYRADKVEALERVIKANEELATADAAVIDWHIANNRELVTKWRTIREKADAVESPDCVHGPGFVSVWNESNGYPAEDPRSAGKPVQPTPEAPSWRFE